MITVDKEEFQIKLDQINSLVEKKNYKNAMEIVDSIDWRRVKSIRTLCTVGEIYAANKRYEDSREILLLAYHRSPIGKTILYRLVEVSIKMDDLNEALDYYTEFVNAAPNDNTQYILKYKIYSARKASLEEQIQILEEYKEREFTERWSFELAKLYYNAGEKEKCIEVCDDIVLWFSEGKYVLKSLELKRRLTELTPSQEKIYQEHVMPAPIKSPVLEKPVLDSNILEENVNKDNDLSDTEKPKINIPVFEMPKLDIPKVDEAKIPFVKAPSLDIEDNELSIKKPDIIEKAEEIITEEKEEEITEKVVEEVVEEKKNLSQTIQDISMAAPIVENDEDFQKKISKGIKDIFSNMGKKSNQEENLFSEEEQIEKQITGQINIADIIPMTTDSKEVPFLEPESVNNDEESPEEEKSLEINLEDTIIAAAAAQGIEVPNTDIPVAEKVFAEETPSAEEPTIEDSIEIEDSAIIEDSITIENPTEIEESSIEEKPVLTEEEMLMQFIDRQNMDPEADPKDIIPRENKLDDDEIKMFSYFSSIPGMKEQLVDALKDTQEAAADKTSNFGNVIIMGNKGCGKSRLADILVKAICRELKIPAAKIAKVTAEQINDKDVAKMINKLAGGFLIIENTNQLKAETVDELGKAMEFRTDGLTVILEDEKIGMRKFIAKYPKFTQKFTSTISIPVFTNDELVNFARVYTKDMGYKMEEMGVLALYTLIGDNQKEDEPMTIEGVKILVDNAIAKAESGTRKLQRNLSKTRTDNDGFIILYEKDFK